ncbi:molecular chaperone HtpG [Pseudonocardia sp. KRD-184]|uniref:Chaperone protein HtpG n=1 Tax=Pseudonocardia oceani TaxID=2792013 RepID=A0ABS6UEM8_9PSEU|nr:molecular chaperone HtpG [Pseudonocardia oceani]MBW0093875.1 molecular chaperone HtpG [Pseudonocardia oceani]MBW0100444.1 molecular chaperone HtpG [Pseudonocardia oceani]MBW0112465.1 molecular chaperone HtpG [Pseudonocardia oceani]MBW0123830.1 molecular chaperone HtpG [Pseudonocardia oceani]MBW0130680.1 molecular chaperone HtpG [Pseudonocardia oceani]
MTTETIEFQAEARQLMQLMIHSIYSNKDVFLRELVSNASDALDKLRLASYQDKELEVDVTDLHVTVRTDPQARTLTVADNGIGMSRDDVVGLIGTIARSGSAEVLAQLRKAKEAGGSSEEASAELIGQFGVGFYSSFMVADRVEMVTRRAGEAAGVHWESAGEGTYTIAEAPDAEQGTTITLHLKPVDVEDGLHDYADDAVVRRLITRYSDFITWPIRMAAGEGGDEVVNSRKALWSRPQSDVSEEEYTEFYRHVSHDWQDPLETIRLSAEGTFEYQALLFLPSHAPMDLFMRDARRGVQLYVKRVFIMDDCEALVPEYLRFVKGVVDAADLSLNVSREILQQDRQIQLIRKRLVKKVLSTVRTMLDTAPEKYATFWSELGRAVKEGLISDHDNRQAILEICSFPTTHDTEKPTTLRDYVARMPEGQDAVYYMTGDSRAALEGSPHMEAFRAKGYEVLLLTDPVDEVWVEAVPEFDGTPLASIAKGDVDLGGDEIDEETKQGFAGLLTWLGEALAEDVKEVRLSHRLTTSAACLVGDPGDLTPTLEKMYRAMGQEPPKVKRILELNPQSPLVTGLARSHEQRGDDEELRGIARLLHGTALLAEGGELPEPAAFAAALSAQLEKALQAQG